MTQYLSLSKSRFLLVLLCVSMFVTPAIAGDWPWWRGPNRDGITTETGWMDKWPEAGPTQIWNRNVGVGYSTVSIVDGKLYTVGNVGEDESQQDVIYCLDAKTGKQVWKYGFDCNLDPKYYMGGPSATPTVTEGKVYYLSKEGHVICLEEKTGKLVWKRHVQEKDGQKAPTWGFAGSVLIHDDLAIINVGPAGMALNKTTGKLVWKSDGGVAGYSTPLPFESGGFKGVALYSAKELVAVDPATGKVLFKQPWKTSYDVNAAEPIFVKDTVFISSGYNTGCALMKVGKEGLTEIWRNKNMSNQCNSSVYLDGHVYGFSGNVGGRGKGKGIMRCLDLKTGETTWSVKRLGTGSVLLAADKLIILGEDGMLVVAEAKPKEYVELGRENIFVNKAQCWTVPVLCNGLIYARSAQGELVCVSLKAPEKK